MALPPRVDCECTRASFANRQFWQCAKCDNRRREPYTLDWRGQRQPHLYNEIPYDFDVGYDRILTDPPDTRSPMIRMLDDEEWRRSLAEAPVDTRFHYPGCATEDRLPCDCARAWDTEEDEGSCYTGFATARVVEKVGFKAWTCPGCHGTVYEGGRHVCR